MKFKGILTLLLAGASLSGFAQTHAEGEEYYKADQFDNAKDLLLRSLNNSATKKAVSDYYLGMVSYEEGDMKAAAKYFAEGLAIDPEYAYNYVGEGLLKLKAGDTKGAEAAFKLADKNSKKDASLQIAIARAYDAVDPVAYEKQITKLVEKARKYNLNNPDIYLFEGDQARANKDWGKAAGMYEMATNYDNNATAAYVKYANLYTMVNPDYAIKMLQNLLSVNPQSALGQRELANAYYNKKNFAEAAKQYGKYVQNPSHFKSDEGRYAFLLFYGGDYQKGYDYATKLLAEDPSNFTAKRYQFMNAAQIPAMADKLPAMADALYAAHKSNPKENKFASIDYTLIANALQADKRADDAIKILEEGVKEMPEFADFNKSLAFAYLDKNDLTNTAKMYQVYLSKIEPGYNDYIQQATFDFYAGVENKDNPTVAQEFYNDAKANADKAKKILPDNYKPVKIYGDIAKQTAASADAAKKAAVSDYEQAVVLLEQADDTSRYARDAKEMYMYLGNYYLDVNNVAKAKENFEKIFQYDPDNTDLRKFVDGLK
ncbi:MAG: tetratricopeptide repeat protein [Muribaculaceae bacterium]|nr:tetratricopeptide repeat protein [Muribaculaceae bacterium]